MPANPHDLFEPIAARLLYEAVVIRHVPVFWMSGGRARTVTTRVACPPTNLNDVACVVSNHVWAQLDHRDRIRGNPPLAYLISWSYSITWHSSGMWDVQLTLFTN